MTLTILTVNLSLADKDAGRHVAQPSVRLEGEIGAGLGRVRTIEGAVEAARRAAGDGKGWGAYCSAKAGLAMLTTALAAETAASGIRSFGLAPGVIDTEMQVTIRASGINRVSRIPRANLAPVEHPAAAILYLCTDAADDLIGKKVSLLDPEFRRRIGLSS